MDFPGLGKLTYNDEYEWFDSEPVALKVLSGHAARFSFEEFEDDPNPADFHKAVANFMALGPEAILAVKDDLWAYYQDVMSEVEDLPEEYQVKIDSPDTIVKHISFGDDIQVARFEDDIYFSYECECEWEVEHGLQLVFKNGERITKLGPYDGHFTNEHAYADQSLAGVIYPRST